MSPINDIHKLPKEWFINDVSDKRLNNIPKYHYKDVRDKCYTKWYKFNDDDIIVYINNGLIPLKYVIDTDSIEILKYNMFYIRLILNQTKEQQLFCCQYSNNTDIFKIFNIKHSDDGTTLIDTDLIYEYFKYGNRIISRNLYNLPHHIQLYIVKKNANNIKFIKFTDPGRSLHNDIIYAAIERDPSMIEYIHDIVPRDYIYGINVQTLIVHHKPANAKYIYNLNEDLQISLLYKGLSNYGYIVNPTQRVIDLYKSMTNNKIDIGFSTEYHNNVVYKTLLNIKQIDDEYINKMKKQRQIDLLAQMKSIMEELQTIDIQ